MNTGAGVSELRSRGRIFGPVVLRDRRVRQGLERVGARRKSVPDISFRVGFSWFQCMYLACILFSMSD